LNARFGKMNGVIFDNSMLGSAFGLGSRGDIT